MGGLGNQLFIYAFGRALELEHNLDIYFDTYSGFKNDPYRRKLELDNFNTKYKKASLYNILFFPINKRLKIISKVLYPGSFYIKEDKNFSVDLLKELFNKQQKIFLQGYFQNPEYFESIKEELKKEMTLKTELSESAKIYLELINNSNSVAIHIRRKEIKDLIPIDFYLKNIKSLEQKIDKPKFFIFSDDINWCKKSIPQNEDIVFITYTSNHIEDFWLMKNCKYFIAGNSTFSWWARWLSSF